jgi:hypothetical protein
MHSFVFLCLFLTSLLSGCLSSGYNQPVYIISDSTLEEEQARLQDEEIR